MQSKPVNRPVQKLTSGMMRSNHSPKTQFNLRILFLHQNFPGQFLHVASYLKGQGIHDLVAVVPEANTRPRLIPTRTYRFDPRIVRTTVPFAQPHAEHTARGIAVAGVLLELKESGFAPDLVIGHGGWGETLFVRDVWPDTRILLHSEFFYSAEGAEAGFDPEFAGKPAKLFALRVRARNTTYSLALSDADRGVAPTEWQASRFPPVLRRKITVAHEGIDTNLVRPWPTATVLINRGTVVLRPGDEVVTFVNRNLEPHRGFHIFMRALPAILAQRPRAQIVIVGGDDTSYGPAPGGGRCWREVMLAEVGSRLDLSRVHFVGRVPYASFIRLLQVSAAHVYLTYPFVLSWSMLEAMSAGALVIGSRTPPVEEVIDPGRNGLVVGFHDLETIVRSVVKALGSPERLLELRQAARDTILTRYDLQRTCLPIWLKLINDTVAHSLQKPSGIESVTDA